MTINRKIIIHAIPAAVVIVVIAVGTVVGLNITDSKKNNTSNTKLVQASVNNLRKKAKKARVSNDQEIAKLLLLQTKKQSSGLLKTDASTNTQEDIKA